MLRVVYGSVIGVLDQPVGTVIPGDAIYPQKSADLLQYRLISQKLATDIDAYLADPDPTAKLKGRLLALVHLIHLVPRDAEGDTGVRATRDHLADLLVTDLRAGSAELRQQVERVLDELLESAELMQANGEYHLQTTASQEWESTFQKQRSRLDKTEHIAPQRKQRIEKLVHRRHRQGPARPGLRQALPQRPDHLRLRRCRLTRQVGPGFHPQRMGRGGVGHPRRAAGPRRRVRRRHRHPPPRNQRQPENLHRAVPRHGQDARTAEHQRPQRGDRQDQGQLRAPPPTRRRGDRPHPRRGGARQRPGVPRRRRPHRPDHPGRVRPRGRGAGGQAALPPLPRRRLPHRPVEAGARPGPQARRQAPQAPRLRGRHPPPVGRGRRAPPRLGPPGQAWLGHRRPLHRRPLRLGRRGRRRRPRGACEGQAPPRHRPRRRGRRGRRPRQEDRRHRDLRRRDGHPRHRRTPPAQGPLPEPRRDQLQHPAARVLCRRARRHPPAAGPRLGGRCAPAPAGRTRRPGSRR